MKMSMRVAHGMPGGNVTLVGAGERGERAARIMRSSGKCTNSDSARSTVSVDQEQRRLSEAGPRPRPFALGFLSKVLALAAGIVVLVAALVFSLVLVAVVASVGIVAWAYLWWRTRDLRKQMRERRGDGRPDTTVIEGEFSRAPRSHDDSESR
jgi:hypothetical protein